MDFRGRWALITGASSGLGREMAGLLAREHGANIIAVARRADRLDELRRELEGDARVRVEPIVADLAVADDVERVIHAAAAAATGGLYAAVLNAGVTYFGDYRRLAWAEFQKMLQVNVVSTVRLATQLIEQIEKTRQGGGLMLVASMAGVTPVPYQTAYSSTKAFIVHFGCGLWHELRGRGVSVTTYAPGGIATEMTAGERFGALRRWLVPVDYAAREGVEAFRSRQYLHIPGSMNRLGLRLVRLLPQRFVTARVGAAYRRSLEMASALASEGGAGLDGSANGS
ncbi:MAG TPA: SDR family NAD(P)-dependent oxidoreductase [Polyangiaceae bacterium]|nr:SDR family NAD(P)-dependent oxidoreductase [Polyangiaceae bacterium]